MDPIIRAENVAKHFGGEQGVVDTLLGNEPSPVRAVDGVNLEVDRGEIVGIAGESGCGKTTLGKLLVKLHEPTSGDVYFDGQRYAEMTAEDEREFRQRVQMIFQDPFESLNPRFTVMDAVAEPLKINDIGDTYDDRRDMVVDSLEDAGLEPAENYLDQFPRNLSGGEQQRVAIARALVVEPDVIVADEPVSMLDVSIRAGVLNLMKELREEYDLTYIFISHDLSLIRYMCDRTAIMYLGDLAETGATEDVITDPKHPYTQALLSAVPVPDPRGGRNRARIEGEIPSPEDPPPGCKFHPRCPDVIPPDDVAIDQGTYRDLMNYRIDLREGNLDSETVRERAELHGEGSDRAALKAELWEEFFDAEPAGENREVVEQSFERLIDGEEEAAMDLLADRFAGVCENVEPSMRRAGEGSQTVTCHLYEPEGDEPVADATDSPGAPRGTSERPGDP